MKRIVISIILISLLAQQCNIFALAPWQDGKNHCGRLVRGSGEEFFIDNHLAFVMPAKGGFDSSFARQLFTRYSIAKELFSRVINYYSLTEEEFFALFDSGSSGIDPEIELSANQSKQKKIKKWGALITFYVALYRVLDEQYSVSIRPFGIMGNSVGIFAAFIAADALDLEDGLNLFHKFCEVSLKTAGKRSFYRMRVFDIPLFEVERLVSSPGLVEVYYVCHRARLQLTEEISLIGDRQALETARNRIEEAYGSGRVEMMGMDYFAPVHTSILRKGSEELKKYVSSIRIKTPKTRIFSSNPDKGVLETAEDIREEIVYTLSHPVRWDKMVENAAVEGVNKFILLGRSGGILKRVPYDGAPVIK